MVWGRVGPDLGTELTILHQNTIVKCFVFVKEIRKGSLTLLSGEVVGDIESQQI